MTILGWTQLFIAPIDVVLLVKQNLNVLHHQLHDTHFLHRHNQYFVGLEDFQSIFGDGGRYRNLCKQKYVCVTL